MIILSFTTLDMLHKYSHGWICKVMGIQTPTTPAMEEGKKAHERLQAHASGKKKIAGIDLPMNFPTAEYHAQKPYNAQYQFHSFLDGVNFASKSGLEIKTSGSKLWSHADFARSMQPVYYSWITQLRDFYFVTCHFDLSGLQVYHSTFTDSDWERARVWAEEGIAIIEKGDYRGGLDEQGRCTGCSYGASCYFL